jgi:fatty-acid peroxygenase
MIDGAGTFGPRNWRGHVLRRRTERWAATLIRGVRAGRLRPPAESAVEVIAFYRDSHRELLNDGTAAVELLNILRPTVAVSRYVAFAAVALHDHPEARAALADGEERVEQFVHEVRRFYPFFPAVAGIVERAFEWRGHRFQPGCRVVLDLYGTNRDPRSWDDPDTFRPDRFERWAGDPFTLVPRGGGDHLEGHRCAGEWVTIELLNVAVQVLARELEYELPPQDLQVRLDRMPARPESGVALAAVRRIASPASV